MATEKNKKLKGKKTIAKVKQYGYMVNIENVCNYEEYGNEPFSSHHSEHSNYFRYIKQCNAKDYPDVTSVYYFDVHSIVYVVWVEWSSGDSFGRDDRINKEAVGVFSDEKSAQELKEAIENWRQDYNKKNNNVEITTADGQYFKTYAFWDDYFGGLDEVHIDQAIMRAAI